MFKKLFGKKKEKTLEYGSDDRVYNPNEKVFKESNLNKILSIKYELVIFFENNSKILL